MAREISQIADTIKKTIKNLKFSFPYSTEEWLGKDMIIENYHKHTAWSNLVQIDSAADEHDFMRKLDNYGCKNFFSGEHGYSGEWLYIYDLCKKTQDKEYREKLGISKPLNFRYSAEVYWVKDINKTIVEEYIDKKGKTQTRQKKDNKNCHMVIVAKNYNAIRKLNYLQSVAHTEGYYYKPRIDLNMLFSLDKEDVFITSACIAGWKYEDAEEIWLKIYNHFGDNFLLEYQAHNTPEQKELNTKIYEISQKYGIQTIIGLDTHFLDDEDKVKRDNLFIRKSIRYPEEDGWYMDFPNGKELYQRMIEQNIIPSHEIIRAMMNTHIFTKGCEDISYNTSFKIPVLEKNLSYEERAKKLQKILNSNYLTKEKNKSSDKVKGIQYEYNEIYESKVIDYSLTNYEIVNLGIKEYGGILTTTSRGSSASHYMSKLLNFTTIDRFESEVPIYPERFITKERILSSHQMPDIDFNVATQEPFIKASKRLLGEHGCYPLLAIGKLGEKSGFKLYADIKGVEPSVANEISKHIEEYNEALNQVEGKDKENILIEDYIKDKELLKVFNESKSYQGIIEQTKVHPCGFLLFNGFEAQNKSIIGYGDIRYEIGLIRCSSKSGKSTIIACVEGDLLDAYGYVKDDFLIVDVVGIIDKLYKAINREVPTVSELREMVLNDKETWDLYSKGITCCLNQCENPSTTKKAKKYKPKNVKELAAFIAAIRPGFKSLLNGFLDRVDYTNGEKAIDDLLEDSLNYMLYQEAVMKIFAWLGIPIKDSYDTIKKISKKKLKGEALEKLENNLREHWFKNIGNMDNFEPIYKVVKDSARYSFNAPHALAMAFDSLYEAWMKAHHTSIFYEVTLNHYQAKLDKNKVAELLKEATTFFGYKIAKYEYGQDNSKFTVNDKEKIIYPNLASLKGVGVNCLIDIKKISDSGIDNFIDIRNAIKGTSVNASVFKNLVKIGYFKRYGSIKKLIKTLEIYEKWSGSSGTGLKTISKSNFSDLGLEDINILKFATDILPSGKKSDKQYSNLDWIGLVKELSSKLSNEEYGIGVLVKFQFEVLGYIDYINADLDTRYMVVTELDTKYSPKFSGYCLKNGKTAEFKIHKRKNFKDKKVKTSWNDCPLENGDIIFFNDWKKEQKRKKTDDGWVNVEGVFDNWLKDYRKVVF